MKDRLPAFIALILLLILVVLTWWAADYAQRAIPIDPPAKITHEPDAWSRAFVMLTSNEKGEAINRVEGKSLRHYPDDNTYEIDEATVIGQHPENPRTMGSADLVVIADEGDLITLKGNAHIHRFPTETDSALDIKSEELIILPKEDIVKTDKLADVQQGNSRMVGQGMYYNNATRRLDVFTNSGVTIAPEDIKKAQDRGSQQ